MSNTLTIRAVEKKTIGMADMAYSLIAVDSYRMGESVPYHSIEALKTKFPTQRAALEYFLETDEFRDCAFVSGEGTVAMQTITSLQFEGIPYDGSLMYEGADTSVSAQAFDTAMNTELRGDNHSRVADALTWFMESESEKGAEDGLAYELAQSLKDEVNSLGQDAFKNLPRVKQAILAYVVESFQHTTTDILED